MGLGPVKPHVKAAAEEVSARFGITNIGGFASSGHISGSDHYAGLAIDVMLGNSGKGDLIAEWALQNAARLGVKYVIYNRRYNGLDGKGWVKYTGPNPHTDHVHISFKPSIGGSSGDPGPQSTGDVIPQTSSDLKGCLGLLTGTEL